MVRLKILPKVSQEAFYLVQLDHPAIGSGAHVMSNFDMWDKVRMASRRLKAETKIDVFNMQKVSLIHPAD
jgi:hypothetical protein